MLSQPHRRGETSHMAGSVFGRFCLRVKANGRLYDAGQEYASLVRRWRAAKGVPMDVRLGVGGSGEGPADSTVKAWGKVITSLSHTMSKANAEGYMAVRQLVLDEYEIGMDQDGAACEALFALAVDLGFAKFHDHPFLA